MKRMINVTIYVDGETCNRIPNFHENDNENVFGVVNVECTTPIRGDNVMLKKTTTPRPSPFVPNGTYNHYLNLCEVEIWGKYVYV